VSTIYGTDMSHYDAAPVDLGARLVDEGFAFHTHKAGGDADDPELGAWWKAVKGQRGKLLLGAYWVLYPGTPVTRAGKFLDRLDALCPGWRDGPFILQLDCEVWNGDASTKPGVRDIRAACLWLKQQAPKLTPVVYASKGQYGNSLDGLGFPLWNANYPSSMTGAASAIYAHVGGDSGPGWTRYSGQMPAIWQFSSSATIAGQTTCDANAYRGTLAALTALVAPGWETDMDLTPQNLDDIAQAVASKLHTDYTVTPPSGLAKDQTASEQRIIKGVTSAVSGLVGTTVTQEQLDLAVLNAVQSYFAKAQQ
jgi:hypothetical protein